jgi:hypothetical protein
VREVLGIGPAEADGRPAEAPPEEAPAEEAPAS